MKIEEEAISSKFSTEYITIEEATAVTGFKDTYLRDLAKKAKITRIGNKSFGRYEFFKYWTVRSLIEDQPKRPREDSKARQHRINQVWKSMEFND